MSQISDGSHQGKIEDSKKLVLLIEDEDVPTNLATVLLEEFGFEVVHQANHQLAESWLSSIVSSEGQLPHIIVSDFDTGLGTGLKEGDKNGVTFLQWMKKNPELKNIPVVAFSANQSSNNTMALLGAVAVEKKNPQGLLDAVAAAEQKVQGRSHS